MLAWAAPPTLSGVSVESLDARVGLKLKRSVQGQSQAEFGNEQPVLRARLGVPFCMYFSLLLLGYLSAKDIFVGLAAFSSLEEMSLGLDRLLLSLLYASPKPTRYSTHSWEGLDSSDISAGASNN